MLLNKGYESFLKQTGSILSDNNSFINTCFNTYKFSTEYGRGYTSIYEVDSYANICIAEHLYVRNFEYVGVCDDSITIHQYDSIDSEHSYPDGDVYAGMQYIYYTPDNKLSQYVIKKNTPAKVMGVQLMPEYYENYLKKEFGMKNIDIKKELQVFSHGVSIPEISSILNQVRNFKGNKFSTKLFFKSKIDELTAVIIQKAEEFRSLKTRVSSADRYAIMEILAYLNKNLSKNLLLSDLAAKAYMSVSKFKYVFKAVAGQTLSEYTIRKKMEYACELLLYSKLYIGEIANLVGYKNSGSFSLQFKKYTGMLPHDYRISNIK